VVVNVLVDAQLSTQYFNCQGPSKYELEVIKFAEESGNRAAERPFGVIYAKYHQYL
jgi:hypothetical protein